MSATRREQLTRRVRVLLALFMVGLVLSGVTALPIEAELKWLTGLLGAPPGSHFDQFTGLTRWLVTVREAVVDTNARYPFLAYGTDWLAFAHLAVAAAFIGPLRDPVRNSWVVTFGLIACAGVLLVALIAGPIRGIPFYWQLIDCSFGVVGAAVLLPCRLAIRELERLGG